MRALFLVACVCLPLMAAGAERLNVKTGLWEITTSMQMSGMPPLPKELLDNLTPEQRAQFEASWKQSLSEQGNAEVDRECITEDDLERPFESGDIDECTHEIVRSTRTMQEFKLVCDGERKGSGTFKIHAPTPETMTGLLDVSVGEGSVLMTIKADMKGRWLGPNCAE